MYSDWSGIEGEESYLTFLLRASRTKDEPLLPLGMKDRLCQGFDFQNQRQST
jgi:hypothetical protein